MCTRDFLAQEFFCAIIFGGEIRGGGGWRKKGGEKLWYHISYVVLFFSSL